MSENQAGGFVGSVDAEEIRMSKVLQRREQCSATVGRKTNTDFLNFKGNFLEQIDELKKQMQTVYDNKIMDVDVLYDITSSIFSSMQYKMDAVLYLNAIYSSDYYIIEHCLRVGILANILANWLGLGAEKAKDATIAGFLHDIGMLQVPKEIIEKQDKLTPEEFAILRDHPVRGTLMLINKGVKQDVLEAIRSHHERFDGSGYPRGIDGSAITDITAIVSIVDVYDSMTSNRPYRVATCPFDVINFFESQMFGMLNPGFVYVFLENIPYMYKNSLVELSDGSSGRIVFVDKNHKTSPIVQLAKTGEMVDLSKSKDLKIIKLL